MTVEGVLSMIAYNLMRHPDGAAPLSGVAVSVTRAASGLLQLGYVIEGKLNEVIFPQPQPPARTEDLWRNTCFEAFIAATHGYYEFNLSPSGQWAAYRFDGYRSGMRDALAPDPQIAWVRNGDTAQLAATLHLPPDVIGPLGLSAVIEHSDGTKSYWALAHLPGRPDFHDPACFAAELPPAG